ncbi:hypothetical protein COZ73_03150, partial [Candidatus Falkowbacteria bacterium CG_4_8_14_3_um_filter_36_11]
MTTWIFPANPDDFLIENAFQELETIDWGTNNKVKTGDFIYIYKSIGKDNLKGKIIMETEVIKENVPNYDYIDDKKFWLRKNFDLTDYKKHIRLELIGKIFNYKISSRLSYENLKKNGLRSTMMGPIKLDNNPRLKVYIENTLNIIMYEKNDLANGTFIAKMPTWLRWLLFLPFAIFGSFIVTIILTLLNIISMHWFFRSNNIPLSDVLVPLFGSFLLGGLFVAIGSVTAPKHQRSIAIALLVLLIIYSICSYFYYLIYLGSDIDIPILNTPWQFQVLFESILTIIGGCVSLYTILYAV